MHQMPRESKINILVVDDDRGPRTLLKTALLDKGFQVSTAKSGEEACQAIDDCHFDLVLTDLKMPGLNGIVLLKKIKMRSPETLVILITGYSSLKSAIDAIREGAYDYLTKPFQLDELYIVVNHACERINLIKENSRLLDILKEIHEKAAKEAENHDTPYSGHEDSLGLIQSLRQQLLKVYSRSAAPKTPQS